jgi:hypothetical protein
MRALEILFIHSPHQDPEEAKDNDEDKIYLIEGIQDQTIKSTP